VDVYKKLFIPMTKVCGQRKKERESKKTKERKKDRRRERKHKLEREKEERKKEKSRYGRYIHAFVDNFHDQRKALLKLREADLTRKHG
jgi:hypothetical protein